MSWNHRIVRQKLENDAGDWLKICEVYYDDKGVPWTHTVDAVGVSGETLEELKQTLEWMQKAVTEPILDEADFVGVCSDIDA